MNARPVYAVSLYCAVALTVPPAPSEAQTRDTGRVPTVIALEPQVELSATVDSDTSCIELLDHSWACEVELGSFFSATLTATASLLSAGRVTSALPVSISAAPSTPNATFVRLDNGVEIFGPVSAIGTVHARYRFEPSPSQVTSSSTAPIVLLATAHTSAAGRDASAPLHILLTVSGEASSERGLRGLLESTRQVLAQIESDAETLSELVPQTAASAEVTVALSQRTRELTLDLDTLIDTKPAGDLAAIDAALDELALSEAKDVCLAPLALSDGSPADPSAPVKKRQGSCASYLDAAQKALKIGLGVVGEIPGGEILTATIEVLQQWVDREAAATEAEAQIEQKLVQLGDRFGRLTVGKPVPIGRGTADEFESEFANEVSIKDRVALLARNATDVLVGKDSGSMDTASFTFPKPAIKTEIEGVEDSLIAIGKKQTDVKAGLERLAFLLGDALIGPLGAIRPGDDWGRKFQEDFGTTTATRNLEHSIKEEIQMIEAQLERIEEKLDDGGQPPGGGGTPPFPPPDTSAALGVGVGMTLDVSHVPARLKLKAVNELVHMFAAKILCGTVPFNPRITNRGFVLSDEFLSPASYSTAVNVTNLGDAAVTFAKSVTIAAPQSEPRGPVSAPVFDTLAPGESLEVDCVDLRRLLADTGGGFLKGFLMIESPAEKVDRQRIGSLQQPLFLHQLEVVSVHTAMHKQIHARDPEFPIED